MRKIILSIICLFSFYFASEVFALSPSPIPIQIAAPAMGVNPNIGIGTLLNNALTIIFVIAALAVLVFLVWGAFEWITSGGDKEALGKARGKITNALIGLVVLALAFLITKVVGQIVNINIMELKSIPTLSQCSGENEKFDPQLNQCVTPVPTRR